MIHSIKRFNLSLKLSKNLKIIIGPLFCFNFDKNIFVQKSHDIQKTSPQNLFRFLSLQTAVSCFLLSSDPCRSWDLCVPALRVRQISLSVANQTYLGVTDNQAFEPSSICSKNMVEYDLLKYFVNTLFHRNVIIELAIIRWSWYL